MSAEQIHPSQPEIPTLLDQDKEWLPPVNMIFKEPLSREIFENFIKFSNDTHERNYDHLGLTLYGNNPHIGCTRDGRLILSISTDQNVDPRIKKLFFTSDLDDDEQKITEWYVADEVDRKIVRGVVGFEYFLTCQDQQTSRSVNQRLVQTSEDDWWANKDGVLEVLLTDSAISGQLHILDNEKAIRDKKDNVLTMITAEEVVEILGNTAIQSQLPMAS